MGHVDELRKKNSRVAILVPAGRGAHPRLLAAIEHFKSEANVCHVGILPGIQLVHVARNRLLWELYRCGVAFTHVLFADDDAVPKAGDLAKLLSHNRDIVSGFSTTRKSPPSSVLYVEPELGKFAAIPFVPDERLLEVAGCGGHFVLVSKKCLDAVGEFHLNAE